MKNIDILPIITLVVASPILLVLFAVLGVFTIGNMILFLANIWAILLIVGLNVAMFLFDRLNTKFIVFNAILIAFLFWIIPIVSFWTTGTVGGICAIPIVNILCAVGAGIGSIVSVFTNLIGMILAALVVSAFSGMFLLLIMKKR